MMTITVNGQEYEFPSIDSFTVREYRAIKHQTGLRMGELPDALAARDADALLAFAIVALLRNRGEQGMKATLEELEDGSPDAISIDVRGAADEEDDESLPPAAGVDATENAEAPVK